MPINYLTAFKTQAAKETMNMSTQKSRKQKYQTLLPLYSAIRGWAFVQTLEDLQYRLKKANQIIAEEIPLEYRQVAQEYIKPLACKILEIQGNGKSGYLT